jgi:hypothetical protein
MLRLKATKTSLYKLVKQYVPVPIMRRTEFKKVLRHPDYFLNWYQEDGFAQAFLAVSMGRPFLSVDVRDIEGHQLSREVHDLTVEGLRELGMIKEVQKGPV